MSVSTHVLDVARGRPAREQLVGFELEGTTTPPGEGATIVDGGRPVGRVTSAKWSAWLGRVIGLAFVPAELARAGQALEVRVDGGSAAARVVLRPFHDPDSARVRS